MSVHRAGTVGLVSTGGFATGCIRLFTRGHWNHVVVAGGDGMMFQAMPGGVDCVAEDSYSDVAWLVNEVFTDEAGVARAAFCESRLGAKYNWPAIAAFGPRFLTPSVAGPFARWANRRDAVICSELAVLAARAGGVDWFPGRLAASVSPEDIDVAFRRAGF